MRKSRDYNEELPGECVLGEMEWCQCVCISGRSEYHIMILLQLWVSVFGWLITMKLIARLPPSVSPFCSICRFFISFQLSQSSYKQVTSHACGRPPTLQSSSRGSTNEMSLSVNVQAASLVFSKLEKKLAVAEVISFSPVTFPLAFSFFKKKWWSPFYKLCFQIPYPKKVCFCTFQI